MGSVHKSLYIFLVSQFSRQIYSSWEVLVEINIENIVDKSCLRYAIVADICKKIYMWTFCNMRRVTKIPKRKSESVNRRRTDNTMTKIERTKRQTTSYKTLHIKLMIEWTGMNLGAPEGLALPASLVATIYFSVSWFGNTFCMYINMGGNISALFIFNLNQFQKM